VKAAWSLVVDVAAFAACAVMFIAFEVMERHWGPNRPEEPRFRRDR
jgi:hypothetical protein